MKLQGFVGGAYTLPSVNVDCQRCVNLFAEIIESGYGKENQQAYLKATAGLVELFTLGQGPIRLIHFDNLESSTQLNRIFVVSGDTVFRLSYSGDTGWETVEQGQLNTATGRVSAASLDQDQGVTVFVDGSADNYVYHKSGGIETFETFSGAGYEAVVNAIQVLWLDGYLIFIDGTNQFYVSDWNSLTVPALNFASAEGSPDAIVAMIANHRELWLLNKNTCEIFSNTGNADFPFERQGGFIENGCLAPESVAKMEGYVFWLGRNANGQGVVYAASGPNHQRISTHAIESAISSFAFIEEAKAYAYQENGHSFYAINFRETTFVYDLSTKLWHERCYLNDGLLERHRADFVVFFPDYGKHLVGDYQNSKIYYFDENVYSDAGQEISRIRTVPHISSGGKRIFFTSLALDAEMGVGLNGFDENVTNDGDPTEDPQVMMQFSDNGGHSWSNEQWRSVGRVGEFKKRAVWRRLGNSRDRVFRFMSTAPVKTVWIGADLDLEVGSA